MKRSLSLDSVRNTFDVEHTADSAADPLVDPIGLLSGLELCLEHEGSASHDSGVDRTELDCLVLLSRRRHFECVGVDHRHDGENLFGLGVLQLPSVDVPPGPLQLEPCHLGAISRLFFDLVCVQLGHLSFDV